MGSHPDIGTPDGDHLDGLVYLVQAGEAKYTPMESLDPVETVKFRMPHRGLSVKYLEAMIGKSNRVCEVLNQKPAHTRHDSPPAPCAGHSCSGVDC